VCSAKLVGVDADAGVAEAQRLMGENAVRRLPVVDDGQIVGIVSMGDLAASGTEDHSPLAEVSKAEPNT
jgi:predicted transcriptional regulator